VGTLGFDPLFREMERESDGETLPEYGSLLEDAIQMRERLNRHGQPFRSLAEVKRCHDRLAANMNYEANGRDCWGLDLKFPPPPIPGTETILALDSPGLLIYEGCKQRHCVAIKAEEVASGQMYVTGSLPRSELRSRSSAPAPAGRLENSAAQLIGR